MIVLEQAGRYAYNYIEGRSEWRPAQANIVMAHEGRYITIKKEGDEKKDFRYDLVTGELERINHYKTKPDKITRTKAKNVTSWFTDCNLVTEDEKFAVLYCYAEKRCSRAFTSPIRFIDRLATNEVATLDHWLGLGVKFRRTNAYLSQLKEGRGSVYYHDWRDDSYLRRDPSEYNKGLLKHIKKLSDETEGGLTFRQVNDMYDYWNDGQYKIFKELEDKMQEKPQYQNIFYAENRNTFTGETTYVNILRSDDNARLRSKVLKCIKKYNLNLDSFLDYCLYLQNVESVSVEQLMADYPDYLKRELHLKGGRMSRMEKYPKTWYSHSHKQRAEYQNLQYLERLEETDNVEKFNNTIADNKHLEWEDGNYLIRMPRNAEDIRDEGDQMNHCVATYIPAIEAGRKMVMFMRDKEKPEESLVTVEIIDGAITQAYAYKDPHPETAHKIWLMKWAHEKDLRITAITMQQELL